MKSLSDLNKTLNDVQAKIAQADAAISVQQETVVEVEYWLKEQGTDIGQIDATILLLEDELVADEAAIEKEALELSEFFDSVLEAVK